MIRDLLIISILLNLTKLTYRVFIIANHYPSLFILLFNYHNEISARISIQIDKSREHYLFIDSKLIVIFPFIFLRLTPFYVKLKNRKIIRPRRYQYQIRLTIPVDIDDSSEMLNNRIEFNYRICQ